MKVFALVLLCALSAVQGRGAVNNKSSLARAELGENPWVVHLRVAVSTSGLLQSCAGSLIDNSWVLTTASCLTSARFIWIRYGTVYVINPSLVTENSAVRLHPAYDASTGANNLGLISINRFVETTDNIAPIALSSDDLPDSGSFCGYGDNGADGPGETLNCFDVSLNVEEDGSVVASGDGGITKYDIGAPVVADGVQVGIIVAEDAEEDSCDGIVVNVADYLEWIEVETGLTLRRESQPESLNVIFVN